jgi:hypothetical protein
MLTLFTLLYTGANITAYFYSGSWRYIFENVFASTGSFASGMIIHGAIIAVIAIAYFLSKMMWIWIAPLTDPFEEKKEIDGRFEKWEMKRLSRRRTANAAGVSPTIDVHERDSDASLVTIPRKTSFGLDKLPPEALLSNSNVMS